MKRFSATQAVVLAAVCLTASGPAQAGGKPIQGDPIAAKIDAPVFLSPTPDCPAFRVHTQLLSTRGAVIGSSKFCVSSATFDEATATQTVTGTLTLHVPGGPIVANATLVEAFAGYPVVTQTISGTVIEGRGQYLGATGTLSGGGTIVFDENDVPHPDLTIVVDLD
jgi:hypothetical protein